MQGLLIFVALVLAATAYPSKKGKCESGLFLQGIDWVALEERIEAFGVEAEADVIAKVVWALDGVERPGPELIDFLRYVLDVDYGLFSQRIAPQLMLWGIVDTEIADHALEDIVNFGTGRREKSERSYLCDPDVDAVAVKQTLKEEIVRMGNTQEYRGALLARLDATYFHPEINRDDHAREQRAMSRALAEQIYRLHRQGVVPRSLLNSLPGFRLRMEIEIDQDRYVENNPHFASDEDWFGPRVALRTFIAEVLAAWAMDPKSPLNEDAVRLLFKMNVGEAVAIRTFNRILREPQKNSPAVVALVESFMRRPAGTEAKIETTSFPPPSSSDF